LTFRVYPVLFQIGAIPENEMRKSNTLPSQEELNRLFRYEPETGLLFWRPRTEDMFVSGGHSAAHTCAKWNSKCANKEAFTTINGAGYRHGSLFGKSVLAHRVIWKLVTGKDAIEVDHEDGNRANNRWVNFREVTSSGNNRNRAQRSDNISGVVGVYWDGRREKWIASTHLHNTTQYIGQFDSFDEAAAARKAAEARLGYHPNHGREAVKLNVGSDPSSLPPLPY
jgi:hypothetical protein